jgi:DNA-directed RNA polymerase I, II, and III subunit RPABC2
VEQDVDGPDNEGGANGDLDGDDMGNIVTSGDISAQERAAKSLNTVKGVKDKKISTENRSTTPYMTKYERARVLGTRALQIR